jgi:hypothetical protein
MPAVAVTLDGKGPFTLGIDTGAPGYLHISQAVAHAAGLAIAGVSIMSDPSGMKPALVPRYRVGGLSFGGVTFLDLDADELPSLGATGAALDGVLGMDLFDTFTLMLDFKERLVTLSPTRLPVPDGQTVFAYDPGPFIQLPLQIGEVTVPTHLDTGQTRSALMVPQDLVGKLATRGEAKRVGAAHTVSQTLDMFSVALDTTVRLGAVRFPISDVEYPTVVPIANLGAPALQSMSVLIDRPSRRIRFLA